MRRIIAVSISAIMFFCSPIAGFAADKKISNESSKVKVHEVSLDTIDELIMKNSQFNKDSEEKKQRLKSDISKYERNIRKIKEQDSADDWGSASTISSLYDQIRTAKNNLEVLNITEEISLKKQAISAKSEYIKYMRMLENYQLFIEKDNQNKLDESIAKAKFERGILSENQYNEKINTSMNYRNEIFEESKKIEKQEEELRTALGLKTEKLKFMDIDEFNYETLKKVNAETDLATALKNSKDIRVQEIKVEQLKNDFVKDRRQISDSEKELRTVKENVQKSFKNQYDQLDIAIKKIEKTNRSWKDAEKELNNAKLKYEKGLLSKNALDNIKIKNLELINQGKDAEAQLQEEFLKYEQIIAGYQGNL